MYGSPNQLELTITTRYAASLKQRQENAYMKVRERMGHQLDRQKDMTGGFMESP